MPNPALMHQMHTNYESTPGSDELWWISRSQKAVFPRFHFWSVKLDHLLILIFGRSMCEGNFLLYINALANMFKLCDMDPNSIARCGNPTNSSIQYFLIGSLPGMLWSARLHIYFQPCSLTKRTNTMSSIYMLKPCASKTPRDNCNILKDWTTCVTSTITTVWRLQHEAIRRGSRKHVSPNTVLSGNW